MTSAEGDERPPIRVVLADANVFYSRVLRDYLLYAVTRGVLEIRWSAAILAEVVEHLHASRHTERNRFSSSGLTTRSPQGSVTRRCRALLRVP